MRRLDLCTKNYFLASFEFFELPILRMKIAKFRKIRIFEFNSASNYSMAMNFHTRELALNTKKEKKNQLAIFEFNWENLAFRA